MSYHSYQRCCATRFQFVKSLSCYTTAKGSSLAAHQTACAVQAVHASPPLFVRRGAILSRRTRRPDRHRKQQSWSAVGTIVFHCRATYVSTFGDRAFSVSAPRAWNNLSPHIKHISSTDVFSKNLKSFLFSCALWLMFLICLLCFMFLFSLVSTLAMFCFIYGALILT